MSVRNEQTLRRMWTEHLTLRTKAAQQAEEETRATEDAIAAERTAKAHRAAAEAARTVGGSMAAESADLADIVNEKRTELDLPPLVPGEPYDDEAPQDPAGPTLADVPLVTPGEYPPPTAPVQQVEWQPAGEQVTP
jgi:hypothetical protein